MPYKNILVPTDGSARSRRATKLAVGSQTMKAVAHSRIPVLVCR